MENIVIFFHILVALAIIGLVLLQQGKGAEAGASFGSGASQTVFGSQGGSNFFAKVTAVLAIIFFASSFSLAIIAKNKASMVLADPAIPSVSEQNVPEDANVTSTSSENTGEAEVSDVPSLAPETDLSKESEDPPTINQ